MKKMIKAMSVFAALAMLGTGFIACSNDDDDDNDTEVTKSNTQSAYKCDNCGTEYGTQEEAAACAKQSGCPKYVAKATAATYDFSALTTTDFTALGTSDSNFYSDSSGNAKNTLKISAGTYTLANKVSVYNKSDNAIMVRTASTTDATPTGLNYNGGEKTDLTEGVTIADVSRYVSFPIDGAGKITVDYKSITSASGSETCQVGLFDSDGTVIKVASVDTTKSNTSTAATMEATVSAATTVYVVFSRNGASGGGLDLNKITVAAD